MTKSREPIHNWSDHPLVVSLVVLAAIFTIAGTIWTFIYTTREKAHLVLEGRPSEPPAIAPGTDRPAATLPVPNQSTLQPPLEAQANDSSHGDVPPRPLRPLRHAVGAPYSVDANTVAYWRFEDAPGAIVADETGRNAGVVSGSARIVAGRYGNALSFRGAEGPCCPHGLGDYVSVADSPSLSNLSQITIQAWVFPASCSFNSEEVVDKGAHNAGTPYNLYELGVDGCPHEASGLVRFHFDFINQVQHGQGSGATATSSSHPIRQWYYLVGVYDGTRSYLYVNGTLEATSHDEPGIIVTTHDPLYIHNHAFIGGPSGGVMGGVVDEIRISNIAREATAMLVGGS
jgi:hypothetical protein